MTLRCEACGQVAWDDDARYCIACGGRLVAAPEPGSPGPDSGRAGAHVPPERPESADARPREPDSGRAGAHAAPERPGSPSPDRAEVPPPDVAPSPLPAPPRPVRGGEGAGGDEVPLALVLAGVVAVLLVLLALLVLT